MDKTILVERDFKDGALLIENLDSNKFPVSSAFWIYNSESELWRLIIATPLVDVLGTKNAYIQVNKIIHKLGDNIDIPLQSISVISPKHMLVKVLRKAIQTEKNAISSIRFTNNTIGNSFIEDAYIYRMS
ncbi:hypothetical protein [Bacillus wiedmannii]|uniref:hypothetical protein n=1 Tax=Bacillus wiedmannii TaxID=1890302 RepID=UPI000BF7E564|nr:hypothetical protein [Bacillus wiedmannii]PFY72530.1 hypothetical protein COL61_14550 [Bacillus wiedmannii]